MIIYIDNNFKCHLENDGTMREVETDFFDGKCRQFVEGYRFVPFGDTWVREDGQTFTGEMIAPWRDYDMLVSLQEQYEEMLAQQQDMAKALEILEVNKE